jgi:hypothetical protein
MGRNRVYHVPSDDVKIPVANATVYAPAPRFVRFGAAFVGPTGYRYYKGSAVAEAGPYLVLVEGQHRLSVVLKRYKQEQTPMKMMANTHGQGQWVWLRLGLPPRRVHAVFVRARMWAHLRVCVPRAYVRARGTLRLCLFWSIKVHFFRVRVLHSCAFLPD